MEVGLVSREVLTVSREGRREGAEGEKGTEVDREL